MKRVIIPEELTFKSASCGFECDNLDEVKAFIIYFNLIGCGFEVDGLYIEPHGELIPLKRTSETKSVWEYIMLEY